MRSMILISVLALAVVALSGSAFGEAQFCRLTLEEFVPAANKDETPAHPLLLHLGIREGQVVAAFATGRGFGTYGHLVDISRLRLQEGKLTGQIDVTFQPDPWTKLDKIGRRFRAELDVRFADGQATGAYRAETDAGEIRGKVSGVRARQPDISVARLNLRIFQALYRLSPEAGQPAVNTNYAIDMNLKVRMQDDKALWGRLQTPVPDYRPYSAVVDDVEVKTDGFSIELVARATVHYHQGQKRGHPMVDRYSYRLEGLCIGDRIAGQTKIQVGSLVGKRPFWGTLTDEPEPKADGNFLWLRLPTAMQGGKPVLLYLAVHENGESHGLAWAPGYNHQPHGVDAGGLKLQGDRLQGRVVVSIVPDVYHSHDVYFDIPLDIDAKIAQGHVRGSFTGTDREVATKGAIVGEVRLKQAPVATQKDLAAVELNFGFANPGAPHKAHHHIRAKGVFGDGEIRQMQVASPGDPNAQWVADEMTFRIDGDKITGTLSFHWQGGTDGQAGQWRYTFQGMVNGEKFFGYWRGWKDDKPILTKSAKISGMIKPRQ